MEGKVTSYQLPVTSFLKKIIFIFLLFAVYADFLSRASSVLCRDCLLARHAGGLFTSSVSAQAKTTSERLKILEEQLSTNNLDATASAAPFAQTEATPAAAKIEEIEKKPDLTQPTKKETRLEKLLKNQELKPLSPINFLRHAIKEAVNREAPPNTIVLVLLFPLVASLVAAARHLVGIKGFGIFTPAVISVAFLATGIVLGIFLFIFILTAATFARILIRRLKIQYLPRMALLLWFVSMSILGLIIISPWIGYQTLMNLGIFPILLFILLAETFIDVQITRSFSQAVSMTVETLVLATIAFYLMSWQFLQDFVLLNPELFALAIVLLNIFVGKYSGLRLLEIWRFRSVIKGK